MKKSVCIRVRWWGGGATIALFRYATLEAVGFW